MRETVPLCGWPSAIGHKASKQLQYFEWVEAEGFKGCNHGKSACAYLDRAFKEKTSEEVFLCLPKATELARVRAGLLALSDHRIKSIACF